MLCYFFAHKWDFAKMGFWANQNKQKQAKWDPILAGMYCKYIYSTKNNSQLGPQHFLDIWMVSWSWAEGPEDLLWKKKYFFPKLLILEERFGGARVSRTPWKPHKSKDNNFLHRSCIPKKNLNSEKIYFFSNLDRRFFFFRSKNFNQKSTFFDSIFGWKFFDLRKNIFFEKFFFHRFEVGKKYFFSELRNFLGYSFDVKNCDLSIYEVSRVFWTL